VVGKGLEDDVAVGKVNVGKNCNVLRVIEALTVVFKPALS